MKLIFLHIPKTAGSSISKVLQHRSKGVWFRHGELERSNTAEVWALDYLSGHFTRKAFSKWVRQNQLTLDDVKIITVVRHPLDQLQSNLSFPFELSRRGEKIGIPWMKDMLSLDPNSAKDLCSIMRKYPWLLNMQWQYLVSGSSLEETLKTVDHIAIFPDTQGTIEYISRLLGITPPQAAVHENASRQKFVKREVFAETPLREFVLEKHSLDMELFSEIVRRRIQQSGLEVLTDLYPITRDLEPDRFLSAWTKQ